MRILALQPFDGGSHRQFLEGWRSQSRHSWTVLGLPPVHWKWRMRHAPWTLAKQAQELLNNGTSFDAVFCTDMLALHEWRGLVGPPLAQLPAVIYFHENQLTYPTSEAASEDLHYGFTNLLAAANAEAVWFNSEFHRREFLEAASGMLKRMPDHRSPELIEDLRTKSRVHYPGIECYRPERRPSRAGRPTTIGWLARWEHDKGTHTFASAIDRLADRDCDFELILLGQQFRTIPTEMQHLQERHANRIRHSGFAETRAEYGKLLGAIDFAASTANHEFFGIAMLEAASAGAIPVLPRRLAYPEVFREKQGEAIFYDATAEDFVEVLMPILKTGASKLQGPAQARSHCFNWQERAGDLDEEIAKLSASRR